MLHNIGFFGTGQPAASAQAAVTDTVGAATTTTPATTSTPWGYSTSTQANDIRARVNELRVDSLAHTVLLNQLRTDLVNLGLIKGSA